MGWWANLSTEGKWLVGSTMAVCLWLASGMVGQHDTPALTAPSLPDVEVTRISSQDYQRVIHVSGFTEAEHNATLAAQTAGKVQATPATRGLEVRAGDVLVELDPADRLLRLHAAEAELTRTRKLAQAARALAKEGYMAGTVLAEREANYQAAQERAAAAKLDMRYTQLSAPFEGVVEDVMVTAGDFVNIGTPMVKLVNRTNILLVGNVAQADRNALQTGVTVSATLLDGTTLPATLRAIATDASPATRTYRIEAVLDTQGTTVPTGMSAKLMVPAGMQDASLVPHAWLVLNDTGEVGVMTVTIPASSTLVHFQSVNLLADTPAGIWVNGLPSNAYVVSRGQAALKDASLVRATEATPSGGNL